MAFGWWTRPLIFIHPPSSAAIFTSSVCTSPFNYSSLIKFHEKQSERAPVQSFTKIDRSTAGEMAPVIFCIDPLIKRVLWKNSPWGRELPGAICPPWRIPANPLMQTSEWIIWFWTCSFWKDFPGLVPCVLDSEPRGEWMKLFPHGRRDPHSRTLRRVSTILQRRTGCGCFFLKRSRPYQ